MTPESSSGANCALCGAGSVHGRESLPAEWEAYLRDERDAAFFGTTAVPLCDGCYPVYHILRSGAYEPRSPERGSKVVEILDKLRLEEVQGEVAVT